jgi:hypothetical protein
LALASGGEQETLSSPLSMATTSNMIASFIYELSLEVLAPVHIHESDPERRSPNRRVHDAHHRSADSLFASVSCRPFAARLTG